MTEDPFELFSPLPPGGEWQFSPMPGEPFAGHVQAHALFSDGRGRMRVLVATWDPEGRPTTASDMVARDGGARQLKAGASVSPDGTVRGTHWTTVGESHTPRPVTAEEGARLLALAAEMWARR